MKRRKGNVMSVWEVHSMEAFQEEQERQEEQ